MNGLSLTRKTLSLWTVTSDSGLHDENAKLLAVPVYNNPAVLYVNLSVLQSVGVVYISVEEDDLDSFNAGGKDENGKTKSDLGLN